LEDLGDVVENFSRKKIDSTVDVVRDEAGRLFDVVDDFVCLRIHSHATVVHALLIFNLKTVVKWLVCLSGYVPEHP